MLNNGESFIVKGKKELIFRRELGETYVFAPYDLLAYKVNDIVTEMMYLVSENYNAEQFKEYFMKKYNATENDVRNSVKELVENNSFVKAIIPNLIVLGIL